MRYSRNFHKTTSFAFFNFKLSVRAVVLKGEFLDLTTDSHSLDVAPEAHEDVENAEIGHKGRF